MLMLLAIYFRFIENEIIYFFWPNHQWEVSDVQIDLKTKKRWLKSNASKESALINKILATMHHLEIHLISAPTSIILKVRRENSMLMDLNIQKVSYFNYICYHFNPECYQLYLNKLILPNISKIS